MENTFDNCEISSKLEIFELKKVPAIIHKFQQQKQVGSHLCSNQKSMLSEKFLNFEKLYNHG